MTKEILFSVTKKDFEVQTFRGSGPGGQHRNKTDSAVRIIHKESGAIGESQTDRSQHTNKRLAFHRLIKSPKFKVWLARKTKEKLSGETIEERVEKSMTPNNLKIEFWEEDKWL